MVCRLFGWLFPLGYFDQSPDCFMHSHSFFVLQICSITIESLFHRDEAVAAWQEMLLEISPYQRCQEGSEKEGVLHEEFYSFGWLSGYTGIKQPNAELDLLFALLELGGSFANDDITNSMVTIGILIALWLLSARKRLERGDQNLEQWFCPRFKKHEV